MLNFEDDGLFDHDRTIGDRASEQQRAGTENRES